MTPTEEQFNRLAAATSSLNAKADEFTAEILALEERLQKMGVAVECWLDDFLGRRTQIAPTKPKGWTRRTEEYYALGYAKIGANWRFAVRPERYIAEEDGGVNSNLLGQEPTGDAVPLAQSPRAVRAEAAEFLDNLLDALAEKTEQLAEKVADGGEHLKGASRKGGQ